MTVDEAIKDIKDNIRPVVGGISLGMAIEALEQAKTNCSEIPNNWIPCSERLPEAKQRVLVTFPDGTVDIKICIDAGHLKWFFAHMVAWMPLPEPYKG